MVRVFIQARMGSSRFPGKVLAPLAGRPVIAHVLAKAIQAVPLESVVVATSTAEADDPLACYLRGTGVKVFRGPLENVFLRFQQCLTEYPCDWFYRVCADSPFLDQALLQQAWHLCQEREVDLITNIFPRTFPAGQSVEFIKAHIFAAIEPQRLTPEEEEHLTLVYYNHPEEFRILNIESPCRTEVEQSLAVDTLEDLRRLERLL
jgi:spore coat polysaccharide biosynthesis protein SpsF